MNHYFFKAFYVNNIINTFNMFNEKNYKTKFAYIFNLFIFLKEFKITFVNLHLFFFLCLPVVRPVMCGLLSSHAHF